MTNMKDDIYLSFFLYFCFDGAYLSKITSFSFAFTVWIDFFFFFFLLQ
jgi:hypothetical protein